MLVADADKSDRYLVICKCDLLRNYYEFLNLLLRYLRNNCPSNIFIEYHLVDNNNINGLGNWKRHIYLFGLEDLVGIFLCNAEKKKKRCLKVTPKVRVLESKKLFVLSTRQPITI